MPDNRNMILAVVLSVAVLLGWHFLVERPRQAQLMAQRAAQTAMEAAKSDPGAPPAPGATLGAAPGASGGAVPGAGGPVTIRPRAEVVAATPRVAIETPKLQGSLSLVGARIDDLRLSAYRETIEAGSPPITLLSPKGVPDAYYAEFGWTAGGVSAPRLPGPDTVWTLAEGRVLTPTSPVTLTYDNGEGLTFTRRIAVDANYLFTVTDIVTNGGAGAQTLFPWGRIARAGTPKVSDLYLLFEGLIGVLDGKLEEIKYKKIGEDKRIEKASTGGWIGITDKYWLTALMPQGTEKLTTSFNHSLVANDNLYQVDYLQEARALAPGDSVTVIGRLFAGAKEVAVLDAYESQQNVPLFDRAIDWGWFYFLTKPIFWLLDLLYRQVGNFGVAIMLLTVVVKAVFFPLANRQYESMSKMKKLQPEVQKIQERFKDDRQRMQQEVMELYKREKANPIAGCLPLLLQIPVFFSLYKVLYITIEMRQAPFFGWIHDLAMPDPTSLFTLFGLIPIPLPDFLHLGVWPLIMGATMFLQQKLSPPPGDPTQEKIFLMMPVIFTFTLAQMPSGLVIYWAWNNLLSIIQQAVIMRRMGVPIEWRRTQPKPAAE